MYTDALTSMISPGKLSLHDCLPPLRRAIKEQGRGYVHLLPFGSVMGPRPSATAQCYVCGREIGWHSLPFHEPRCLSRWRADVANLPPDKRPPTPSKHELAPGDCVWTCLRCYNVLPASMRREEHANQCIAPALPRLAERPKTRTLGPRPPRPLTQTVISRPQTQTLNRPTPNLDHPVIEGDDVGEAEVQQTSLPLGIESDCEQNVLSSTDTEEQPSVESSRQDSINKKTATIRGAEKSKGPGGVKGGGAGGGGGEPQRQADGSLPPACRSCQRLQAPERLHSHHRSHQRLRQRQRKVNNAKSEKIKTKPGDTNVDVVPDVNILSKNLGAVEVMTESVGIPEPENTSFEDVSVNDVNAILTIGHAQDASQAEAAAEELLSVSDSTSDSLEVTSTCSSAMSADIKEEGSGGSESSRKPRTIICYLCGRDFGSRSYPFHEPHCIERWRRENAALPADLRRPLPQRPDTASANGLLNDSSSWETFQAQLVACPTCGRTFFPNRLPVHQKVCKGPNSNSVQPHATLQPISKPQAVQSPVSELDSQKHNQVPIVKAPLARSRPRRGQAASIAALTATSSAVNSLSSVSEPSEKTGCPCYICGRRFGSVSLSLHEPQCLRKWQAANALLPTGMQRPEPQRPTFSFSEDGSVENASNEEEAWKSHLEQLAPCGRCGRTFFPDRLQLHQRHCKAQPVPSDSNGLAPPHTNNVATQQTRQQQQHRQQLGVPCL